MEALAEGELVGDALAGVVVAALAEEDEEEEDEELEVLEEAEEDEVWEEALVEPDVAEALDAVAEFGEEMLNWGLKLFRFGLSSSMISSA